LVTPEALEDLKETMKMGKIATIGQADEFLRERHGIGHKIKLKTGRPRHEEANPEEQEAFKKTSRARSGG